jgi:CheY-like chemotaxis protein
MNRIPDLAYPARILIVDDERQNRQLLEVMLGPEGFHIQTAASGEEALFLVRERPPDLILLDVMMPGVDGYQLATMIKRNPATRNILIIMVTALTNPSATLRALDVGAEDFLTKPVDRTELCVRVRNLLRLNAHGADHDRDSPVAGEEAGSPTADLGESEGLYRSAFYAASAEAEAWNQATAGPGERPAFDERRRRPEAPASANEQLLERGRAEGLADGIEQGEVRSLRTAITHVLTARALSLSDLGRGRLTSCANAAVLTGWLERAATAASEAEVFAKVDNA